jgi:hypothetical protein
MLYTVIFNSYQDFGRDFAIQYLNLKSVGGGDKLLQQFSNYLVDYRENNS